MDQFRKFPRSSALLLLALMAPAIASAIDVPAGTEIQLRLKSKVSSQSSKPKDPVEAVVISPVMAGGQFVIPAGALIRGVVESAAQSAKADERSSLGLNFNELEIDGTKVKLSAQVASVENARESVDEKGQINGILATETITGKLDAGINKLAEKYSGFAGVLGVVKSSVFKAAESDISYDAGVEMAVRLTAPLTLRGRRERVPRRNSNQSRMRMHYSRWSPKSRSRRSQRIRPSRPTSPI